MANICYGWRMRMRRAWLSSIRPLRSRPGLPPSIWPLANEPDNETSLAPASGEWIASDGPVCPMADLAMPHRMAAALTDARRYGLITLVGAASDDEPRALHICHERTRQANWASVVHPVVAFRARRSQCAMRSEAHRLPNTFSLSTFSFCLPCCCLSLSLPSPKGVKSSSDAKLGRPKRKPWP